MILKRINSIQDPLVKKRYLRYYQLPESLQKIIFSPKTAEIIEKICKNNNLANQQIPKIAYITGMVLLGELNIAKFLKTLQEKSNLEKEKTRQIAQEINQKVFLPVKDSLKLIHQVNRWPREEDSGTNIKPEKKQEETQKEPKKTIQEEPQEELQKKPEETNKTKTTEEENNNHKEENFKNLAQPLNEENSNGNVVDLRNNE